MDKPASVDAELSMGDLQLPADLPVHNATCLVPLHEDRARAVTERIDGFFAGVDAGAFEIWSIWPTPDLSRFGFHAFSVPAMVRERSDEPPPAPPAELGSRQPRAPMRSPAPRA
jgi:hypothetical protein